ncbi:MAG: RNA-guided pseudouridylation complex pseudouridine synthase subunit Cbf5 [Candidatus Woesearchaeota archaeon]
MLPEELIIREATTPSEKYGCDPFKRPLQDLIEFGIVVIDKPSGPTSHQVSAYVQKILGITKSGHSGTLDPKVTGVLPVATLKATRLMEYGLKAGKTYVGVMHLHADVEEYEIRKMAHDFIGQITQLPPKRSAVARKNRKRTIYSFKFLEIQGRDILFVADVEAGTYIRKLCHDFGEKLGVGAHMAELRRTRAGPCNEEESITLQELTDVYAEAKAGREEAFRKVFLPAETYVEHLPAIVVLESAIHSLTQGATLKVPGISAYSPGINANSQVRLLSPKGELIGIGTSRLHEKYFAEDKGVAVKIDKVFMESSVYPRMS